MYNIYLIDDERHIIAWLREMIEVYAKGQGQSMSINSSTIPLTLTYSLRM